MKCDDMAELLSAYGDGQLEPQTMLEVAVHVAECSRCRNELAEIERSKAFLAGIPAQEMPQPVSSRIQAAINEAGEPSLGLQYLFGHFASARIRWAAVGAASAAVALLFLAANREEKTIPLNILLAEHVQSARTVEINRAAVVLNP